MLMSSSHVSRGSRHLAFPLERGDVGRRVVTEAGGAYVSQMGRTSALEISRTKILVPFIQELLQILEMFKQNFLEMLLRIPV